MSLLACGQFPEILKKSLPFAPSPNIYFLVIFAPYFELKMKKAEIHTEKGVLNIELYWEETPITVANFIKLAKQGFYNGLSFHRVIPDFVIQGGCPRGNGTGGPGYTIPCETKADNQYHDRGVLSMAHAGPNTGGSQFFVCLTRQSTQHLDGHHTCFGKVTEGIDAIDQIKAGDKIEKVVIIEN